MSVVFSDEPYRRPALFWAIGVKGDKFICAVLIQPVDLDGMLQSIGQEKHLDLVGKERKK